MHNCEAHVFPNETPLALHHFSNKIVLFHRACWWVEGWVASCLCCPWQAVQLLLLPATGVGRKARLHANEWHKQQRNDRNEGNMAVMQGEVLLPVSRRRVADFVNLISTF